MTRQASALRKAVTAYEAAYVAIRAQTRALAAHPDGEIARRAEAVDWTATFLFRRLHEMEDKMTEVQSK